MEASAAVIELIAEQTGDVFVVTAPGGVVTYISGSIRSLGYAPEDVIGRTAIEFIHPDDREKIIANTQATFRGENLSPADRQHRFRTRDGAWIWVEGNPRVRRDEHGKVIEAVNVLRNVTERREAETKAAEAAAILQSAFEHEGVGKAIIGLDGRFLSINSAFCDLLGHTQERMLGLDFQTITDPADLEIDLEHLARLTAGESSSYRIDKRYVRADGSTLWADLTVSMIRDEHGAPKLYIAQIQDKTHRRAAEAALEQSEARYRLLAENAADVIACFDDKAVFTYLSPSIETVLGYRPEELLGKSTRLIMHPDDYKASLTIYGKHLAGPNPREPFSFEYRAFRKDGSEVWLAAHPRAIFDPADGRLTGFHDVVRDVSDRRTIEAALARSEAQFRLLAENASDLIMVCRPDGILTYLSPSVATTTGYRPEDVVGKTALAWIHPEDRQVVVDAFTEQVSSRGAAAPPVVAFRVVRKDGEAIWLESSPRAQIDPKTGDVTHITDAARNITKRKIAEARLAEAKLQAEAAADAKAAFLATMSHELRTPLTAVVGFARLTAEQPDLPPAARSYVDRLLIGAKALMATVNDILDFSKLEAGQVEIRPRPVQPETVLAESVGMFETLAADRGLDLSLEWTTPPPEALLLDDDRIRQVLLNLIGNAVKFTDAGKVEVEAAYDAGTRRLRCGVRDTGPGLSAEQKAQLFRRFSQVDGTLARKHGGTGLGLAICKGIIEAMGGQIGVDSTPGAGACFWFELPAEPARRPVGQHDVESDPITQSRILLAEDNATNRELVRLILRPFGIELIEAADGEEAVRLANDWPVDLILMDLRMPNLDGREAAMAIRAGDGPNAGVPILAFSADAVSDVWPFDGAVRKPLDAGALVRSIADALTPRAALEGIAHAAR